MVLDLVRACGNSLRVVHSDVEVVVLGVGVVRVPADSEANWVIRIAWLLHDLVESFVRIVVLELQQITCLGLMGFNHSLCDVFKHRVCFKCQFGVGCVRDDSDTLRAIGCAVQELKGRFVDDIVLRCFVIADEVVVLWSRGGDPIIVFTERFRIL